MQDNLKKNKISQDESAETKRFDHHLIDQDLELEDKNGRRIDPKKELRKQIKDSSRQTDKATRNSSSPSE